ncbi:MAG: hypothetical protein ACTSPB_00525 [Candidatus Thorarchaeota archaeon]
MDFDGAWFILYRETNEDELQVYSGSKLGQAICYTTGEIAEKKAKEILDNYPSVIEVGVVHSDIRFGGMLIVN